MQRRGHLTDMPSAVELAVGTREKLERLPVAWWHTWRLGETLGAGPKHPVIFECVGVPGVIESILQGAPLLSRVVVVGVVVGSDQVTPAMAINKEIDLRFVLGYTPLEFRDTLQMLAEGKVDPRPLITGTVGLDGVDAAFSALGGVGGGDRPRQDPDRPAQHRSRRRDGARRLGWVRTPVASTTWRARRVRHRRSEPPRLERFVGSSSPGAYTQVAAH